MAYYEIRHVVGFEETNVVGNAYYAHAVRWQGRCRELFLRERAPEMLDEIEGGLALVTLRVSCEYLSELRAFDEVSIRMRLLELAPHRMRVGFETWRLEAPAQGAGETLVNRGEQALACMRRRDGKLEPERWPDPLVDALVPYAQAGAAPGR